MTEAASTTAAGSTAAAYTAIPTTSNVIVNCKCSNTPTTGPACIATFSQYTATLLDVGLGLSLWRLEICVNLAADSSNCGACGGTVSLPLFCIFWGGGDDLLIIFR